jgi:hypothetical protein
MNVNTVADALLIGAAVVWVLARQVRVARVRPRLLWLAPLVLAYFGFRALPASTWHMAADLGLIAFGAACCTSSMPPPGTVTPRAWARSWSRWRSASRPRTPSSRCG